MRLTPINSAEPLAIGKRVSLVRRWLARVIHEENGFLFLIGARWLSLLPPLLVVWWQPGALTSGLLWWEIFAVAVAANLALSLAHEKLDRRVLRQPLLLGVDMAFGATLMALTGGATSPFFFYALTPVLAGAFFFSMRGGLLAALAFTPFYVLALLWSHRVAGVELRPVDVIVEGCVLYGAAFVFGYQALLLRRLRASSDDLRQAQDELGRAETLAAVGKMVAHVSHEIRNPLVTLGGYAHSLARHPDDAEKVRHRAGIIASEIGRLEELLNDLLDLSRPRDAPKTSGNLHEVLDRACLLACGDWDKHNIVLRKDYAPALPLLCMNTSALLRAFLNVTRNAMQAMPDGGTLTLSTRRNDDEIVITIADTGKGIASDKLPGIWTPFVTHREHGTGLGLTVTQQIIGEHGGHIEVESEEGQGTSFVFHLPGNGNAEG